VWRYKEQHRKWGILNDEMDVKNNFISNQPAVKHFDHLSNILA